MFDDCFKIHTLIGDGRRRHLVAEVPHAKEEFVGHVSRSGCELVEVEELRRQDRKTGIVAQHPVVDFIVLGHRRAEVQAGVHRGTADLGDGGKIGTRRRFHFGHLDQEVVFFSKVLETLITFIFVTVLVDR